MLRARFWSVAYLPSPLPLHLLQFQQETLNYITVVIWKVNLIKGHFTKVWVGLRQASGTAQSLRRQKGTGEGTVHQSCFFDLLVVLPLTNLTRTQSQSFGGIWPSREGTNGISRAGVLIQRKGMYLKCRGPVLSWNTSAQSRQVPLLFPHLQDKHNMSVEFFIRDP